MQPYLPFKVPGWVVSNKIKLPSLQKKLESHWPLTLSWELFFEDHTQDNDRRRRIRINIDELGEWWRNIYIGVSQQARWIKGGDQYPE